MSVSFDLWGQRGWAGFDVVGESHYKQSIRSLFDSGLKGDGAELTVTVQLVPDPKNKFDRNAVGVWIGPRQLGFLPRDEAARYAPVLSGLVAEGWAPQVSARVWAVVPDQPAPPTPAPARGHEPIPSAPTGIKFVVPPDWPQPPAGWTPPSGWRPDPTWSPAPYGWQWWIPVWE